MSRPGHRRGRRTGPRIGVLEVEPGVVRLARPATAGARSGEGIAHLILAEELAAVLLPPTRKS